MKIFWLLLLVVLLPLTSAAHYVVGQVTDAEDLTSANGKVVILWDPSIGIADNITDIVGTSGNSGVDNTYFVDCEMLSSPCGIGSVINAYIPDTGSGYTSDIMNVTITGAGYDLMSNITLNPQIGFYNISVDDSFIDQYKEIDLIPASTTQAFCGGVVKGPNMDSQIVSASSELFSATSSFYKDSDQGNKHYTNSTCSIITSYGNSEEAYINCSYSLQYYSLPSNWTCALNITKSGIALTKVGTGNGYINSLLALQLPDTMQFNAGAPAQVSFETSVQVSNMGNVPMNLSIGGYAVTPGDNLSMTCPDAIVKNISIYNQGYNLTASNPGDLSLPEFQSKYRLVNETTKVNRFDLAPRQSDMTNDAVKMTYWRTYIPAGVSGSCTGNIVFGAVNLPAN